MNAAIWEVTKNELVRIVQSSVSKADVLRKLNYVNLAASLYHKLTARLICENIDISHFGTPKQPYCLRRKRSFAEYIATPGPKSGHCLRHKILDENLLIYKCYICDKPPFANGKPLVLQLDHINGDRCNNQLSNLRFLCPDCHSQTETYTARNKKSNPVRCLECNIIITKHAQRCLSCSSAIHRAKRRKVIRPSKEKLQTLIKTTPFTRLGELYGVSDNAIRKWCKAYDLPHRKKDIRNL